MKAIQSIYDIEHLKGERKLPMPFIQEIERDFLDVYAANSQEDDYLLNYRLPLLQALFVFEAGDDVLAKINDPFNLEYVERIEIREIQYYRCALRKGEDFQLYYSLLNTHSPDVEEWLRKQAGWNERLGGS